VYDKHTRLLISNVQP